MSAKVDAERREERRLEAVRRANLLLVKMTRLVRLFESGQSDASIAEQLGWVPSTVYRYRQVLQLRLGTDCGGRWSEQLREKT